MRMWLLKFMGLMLWGMFLFAPFIARADEGFDTYIRYMEPVQQEKSAGWFSFLDDVDVRLGYAEDVRGQESHQWSLTLMAGKDSVLSHALPKKIMHDRIPLDDGERESMRFGMGLRYTF